MTPAEFISIGQGLAARAPVTYGKGWQSAIARQVGVNARTVRRWITGERHISKPTARLIRRIAADTI